MSEEWICCECPKSRAGKHEILWSFGQYGNNPLKKEDAVLGNQYCEEHFLKKEKELDEAYDKSNS